MADDDLSPLDWLGRLGPELRARAELIRYYRRYYRGDHDLPAGPQQHREAYKRFQALARTNLCGLCVDSRVHRMSVIGVSDGTAAGGSNDTLWKLWQSAKLDSRQFAVYRRGFSESVSYVIVAPHPTKPNTPRVSIEGPLHVIVAHDPAEPQERLAALRLWHDPYAKRWMATVWVPGQRHHFVSTKEYKSEFEGLVGFSPEDWQVRSDPTRAGTGIPVIPFANGDEGEEPRAAFATGLDVQNRLNLTLLNRLTSERYAAFRQRYLLNYTPEEDPVTGLPVPPFNPGADVTITVPPNDPGEAPPQIGDLAQTDTANMLQAGSADIRSFAAVTLTPVYYLPGGDLINISGDSIAALDAGHVQLIKERIAAWSENWEEVLGSMADIAGLDQDLSSSEMRWAQPEQVQPGVLADYGSKLVAMGYPLPIVAQRLGDSPQQIAQLRAEMAKAQLQAALTAPATIPASGGAPGVRKAPQQSTGAPGGAGPRQATGAPQQAGGQRPAGAPQPAPRPSAGTKP